MKKRTNLTGASPGKRVGWTHMTSVARETIKGMGLEAQPRVGDQAPEAYNLSAFGCPTEAENSNFASFAIFCVMDS